jgi:hypothetical protein
MSAALFDSTQHDGEEGGGTDCKVALVSGSIGIAYQ